MHILIAVLGPFVGGHTRSALSIARALSRRGHAVDFMIFCLGENLVELPKDPAITFYISRLTPFFTVAANSWPLDLKKYDVLHAFDVIAAWVIHNMKQPCFKPLICTMAGGDPKVQEAVPRVNGLHFYNHEQMGFFSKIYKLPPEKILVEPARIEAQVPEVKLEYRQYLEEAGVDLSRPIIMNISRVDGIYKKMIINIAELVEKLNVQGGSWQFVHIGTVEEVWAYKEIKLYIQNKENASQKKIFFHLEKGWREAKNYYPWATAIGAVGRSALEGMVLSKPVFIVGKYGYAGMVLPECLQDLEKYNFSGRNANMGKCLALSEDDLIAKLLGYPNSDAELKRWGSFGREYLENNMSADKGAQRLEVFYRSLGNSFGEMGLSARDFYFKKMLKKVFLNFFPVNWVEPIRKLQDKLCIH